MDLYLFYTKKMSKYTQDGNFTCDLKNDFNFTFRSNGKINIKTRAILNDRIVLGIFIQLFKEEKLSINAQKDMNSQLLINEIAYTCIRLRRDLNTGLMKTINISYLGKVLYCYVKQLHIVNLLDMMIYNIKKFYPLFKRVLLYPVFRDWVSLRSFIENYRTYIITNKENYKSSELYMIYQLELQRSNLINLVC